MSEKFEEYLLELAKNDEIVSDILNIPAFQYGTPESKEVRVGAKYPSSGSKRDRVIRTLKDSLDIDDADAVT